MALLVAAGTDPVMWSQAGFKPASVKNTARP